jgi:hypothetical protein
MQHVISNVMLGIILCIGLVPSVFGLAGLAVLLWEHYFKKPKMMPSWYVPPMNYQCSSPILKQEMPRAKSIKERYDETLVWNAQQYHTPTIDPKRLN